MSNLYPFAWLDELVAVRLNPALTTGANTFTDLLTEIPLQVDALERQIRSATFATLQLQQQEQIVRHYNEELQHLKARALRYLRQAVPANGPQAQAGKTLLVHLNQLEARLADRYPMAWLERTPAAEPDVLKLRLRLSADQIAIISRAAYLSGVLPAASLRECYRMVARHLRTEQVSDLSEDSLRTHGASPDQRDLDIAAGSLEAMAVLIRDPDRYFSTEVIRVEALTSDQSNN